MLTIVQIEWLKLKGLRVFSLVTMIPLFAVISGRYFARSLVSNGVPIWEAAYMGGIYLYTALLLPLLIVMVMAMINRVEHSQNNWKQVLSFPLKREEVYFSKLALGMGLIMYNFLILAVGVVISGRLMGATTPVPLPLVLGRPALMMIASLPIVGVQFYLSLRFPYISIPLGVGVGLTLPTALIVNSVKYRIFYPWTYPLIASMSFDGQRQEIIYLISIVSFFLIIFAGVWHFKKKDII